MNATFSIFDLSNGALTGQTLCVPPEALAANTPVGFGVIEGAWDSSVWKVDLASLQAVPKRSEARPDDTDQITWSWSEPDNRWIPTPTLAKERADRIAVVDRAIIKAEAGTDRALREFIIAAGLPVAAVARMQAIEAQVSALRATRQALLSADSIEEVLAVEMPLEGA